MSLKDLKILSTYLLNREESYSEYWYTNIIERGELIFIEIEGQILITNKDLEIISDFQKYFNEQIVEIQEEVIILDSDGEEKRLYILGNK